MKSLTVSEQERNAIIDAFPLLEKIQDADIREKVIVAWAIAWRQSSYKTLEEAPQGVGRPYDDLENNLVKHTNATTTGALAMGQQLQEEYGVDINLDFLIAGSLLHDVDKIIWFEGPKEEVRYSKQSDLFVHGVYGAHIALLAGLSMDIAHIIMTHAKEVNAEPKTPEAILVKQADYGKFYALLACKENKADVTP